MKGKNLKLSLLQNYDYAAKLMNDQELTKYMFFGRTPITADGVKKLADDPQNIFFLIESKDVVGIAALLGIDRLSGITGTSMIIEKDCWSRGYGMETIALLTKYAFETLNLHNVQVGGCRKNTNGVVKYFEALGFTYVGKRREMLYRNSERYDAVYLDMLKHEYQKKYKKLHEKHF